MSENKTTSAESKQAIVAVSQAMLDGRIDLIEGVRKICRLRFEYGDPDSALFLPFRGIDSETEHFPRGNLRDRYASGSLKKIDSESDAYLATARDDILQCCRELVQALT
ncbi:MAG: DUF2489 domain-containing protein [Betaproteobacteria bacterium]|nr:DUF2489 domain-containing protein [Betaproteobacteria bacterium]